MTGCKFRTGSDCYHKLLVNMAVLEAEAVEDQAEDTEQAEIEAEYRAEDYDALQGDIDFNPTEFMAAA